MGQELLKHYAESPYLHAFGEVRGNGGSTFIDARSSEVTYERSVVVDKDVVGVEISVNDVTPVEVLRSTRYVVSVGGDLTWCERCIVGVDISRTALEAGRAREITEGWRNKVKNESALPMRVALKWSDCGDKVHVSTSMDGGSHLIV